MHYQRSSSSLISILSVLCISNVLAQAPAHVTPPAQLQQRALQPSCTTTGDNVVSCESGIYAHNLPETQLRLDGGYQWLTDLVETDDGKTTTTQTWDDPQTSYLKLVTTTISDKPTTSTQYISFMNAEPTAGSAAAIAGVVIAPVLASNLKDVGNNVAGKSVEDIISQINTVAKKLKITLTAGDVALLARYLEGLALVGAAGVGTSVVVNSYLSGVSIPKDAEAPAEATTSSSAEPTITAIVKPPYDNWKDLFSDKPDPKAPVPEPNMDVDDAGGDDAKAKCSPDIHAGTDPAVVTKLALQFCDDKTLDFSKDVSKELKATDPISIDFKYTHADGECSTNCASIYSQMISSCQYDSHTFTGDASLELGCGTYELTIKNSSPPDPSPTPTGDAPGPQRTCNAGRPHTVPRDAGIAAAAKFCSDNDGQYLRAMPSNPYSNAITGYNKDGAASGSQMYMFAYLDEPCKDKGDVKIVKDDCVSAFGALIDNCNTNTGDKNGGAASFNCQWYNMTAVDACAGTTGAITDPGSCDIGMIPGSYAGWPWS